MTRVTKMDVLVKVRPEDLEDAFQTIEDLKTAWLFDLPGVQRLDRKMLKELALHGKRLH